MSLLRAFEATARTGSATKAAKELDLTQSAVSKQIKALEEQLNAQLFVRRNQTISLTPIGSHYAREIGDCLARVGQASLNLSTSAFGGTLTLAMPPRFGTQWLAPRLPNFLSANPGVTIYLITRRSRFDFQDEAEGIDAAIHFGGSNWPGAEGVLLRTEHVVPVCSPALKKKLGFKKPQDLTNATLLHLTSRRNAWERWFSANQVMTKHVQAMFFDQFATAAQAAMAGVGVGLLPTFLIEQELKSRRLVRALNIPMKSDEAYYLVWPAERANFPPLLAFREWLLEKTKSDRQAG